MKTKLFLSFILALSPVLCALSSLEAQVPQGFNYQAIARDGVTGNPIANATIKVKLSILSDTTGFYGGTGGVYLWEEEHTNVTTNAQGLFTIVLGSPSAVKVQGSAASFSEIDWSAANLFIGTKIANPTTYKVLGSAKLWSVPYALRAKDSEQWQTSGSNIYRASGNLGIGTSSPSYKLDVTGEITSRSPNSFRLRQSSYSTILRNDNTDFYLLLTNSGSPDGTWNSLRPFRVNLATGNTILGDGALTVNHGGNIGIGTTSPAGRMVIQPPSVWDDNIPLFEVKNKLGVSVLAVYNNGVRILVEDTDGKGVKGGFAIGGFDPTKGPGSETVNLMTVSSDSIRMYIDDLPVKGIKGGFAIGGFNEAKAGKINYLKVDTGQIKGGKKEYIQFSGFNTFIGYEAGKANPVANPTYNTFIGYMAGYSNTGSIATYNLFIGQEAGYGSTTGTNNVLLGLRSGYQLGANAHNNVFIGKWSGYKTSGSDNIFIGNSSGLNNTSGNGNVFLGLSAGLKNDTGYGNLFLASNAGQENTTGYHNVFMGYAAGNLNKTGNFNIYIGVQAGTKNLNNNNVFIGYQSGFNNINGTGNLFLGYQAGFNETGNNKLYIDNSSTSSPLIYGDFSDGSEKLIINGNLGVGVSSPSAKLDVNGTTKLGTNGTVLTKVIKATVSKDLPSIAANSSSLQTFLVANAAVNSSVMISPASDLSDGLVISYARVSSAGTVTVKFRNVSGSAIDAPAMNFYITVIE